MKLNPMQRYFAKRFRIERENRGWSQAHVAELLKQRGVHLHSTSVAKIETGVRAVRLEEASAIADLFGAPLHVMLGRRATAMSSYVLRSVIYTLHQLQLQIATSADELDDMIAELDTIDFDGREQLDANMRRAQVALREAQDALAMHIEVPMTASPALPTEQSGAPV